MDSITKKDLETLRLQLIADLKKLLEKPAESKPDEKEWLRSKEVKKILSISDAALQNLRIRGVVHPVKISGLYYYKSEELKSLFKQ
ncbi:helix-turn-helix domain-containing protein [Algoriphagus yeomjeoni]|uniref:Helix-turn-helix protein n=1 Tax=Algoriphagus yeomjeoni TaxID=291403 RepID=A0A327PAM3_9BACT|nr:helix-turn-helix domain-containing protein [Algoriphagus yeomjeoni]RAI88102.1 hypothetical protein LV83_03020 [Algoriphagus yeomjeoni]